MIRIALLLLIARSAFSQPGLYVDLAGPWRLTTDNSPEMSRPDYDDHRWQTVTIPLREQTDLAPDDGRGMERRGLRGWLRRSVVLPEWADRRKLALTLGPFRSVYEVYVNGALIAQVGTFHTHANSEVARTRTFAIPPEAAAGDEAIQIAIRFDRSMGGGAYLKADQRAPYLVTYLENAPVS